MKETVSTFDRQMSAAAFAEANEHETAREILGSEAQKEPARARAKAPKGKPYIKALVFGLISLSLYLIVFKNERLVTQTFTMGGWYAAFPVGTALIFSFIHGAFASNLLSILGIEAKK